MKSQLIKLSIFSLALLAGGIHAGNAQVLTFEGLQNTEAVSNYYNGGTGGAGSTGGPNYGISFSGNSLALISNTAGGSGNFSGEPSPSTILFFLSGSAATLNAPAGFNTGFSFYYASSQNATVNVYDGLNGSGTLLGSLNLVATPNPYNVWTPVGVTFAGTAKSVDFGGAANFVGFDDITINSATPGTAAVPEPGNVALLIGMASVGGAFLRRRRK